MTSDPDSIEHTDVDIGVFQISIVSPSFAVAARVVVVVRAVSEFLQQLHAPLYLL